MKIIRIARLLVLGLTTMNNGCPKDWFSGDKSNNSSNKKTTNKRSTTPPSKSGSKDGLPSGYDPKRSEFSSAPSFTDNSCSGYKSGYESEGSQADCATKSPNKAMKRKNDCKDKSSATCKKRSIDTSRLKKDLGEIKPENDKGAWAEPSKEQIKHRFLSLNPEILGDTIEVIDISHTRNEATIRFENWDTFSSRYLSVKYTMPESYSEENFNKIERNINNMTKLLKQDKERIAEIQSLLNRQFDRCSQNRYSQENQDHCSRKKYNASKKDKIKEARDILDIGENCTYEEAKEIYKALCEKHDPDNYQDDERLSPIGNQRTKDRNKKRLNRINDAWTFLEPYLKEVDFKGNKNTREQDDTPIIGIAG